MSLLLSRPPEEAARLVALTLLARAEEAATRLGDPDDAEALHDFRVSLRRLRSVVRAYRGPLAGSIKKRHLRQLRDLARATGDGRDAEVALAWLSEQRGRLQEAQQAGLDWLEARLTKRRDAGYEQAQQGLAEGFEPLASELQKRLGVYTREVRLDGGAGDDRFGDLVAAEARRDLARLEEMLAGLAAADDAPRAHRARLASKRLRYLLEPLGSELPVVQPIVKRLKRLQDLLGDMNDAHVLEDELSIAVETAAKQRARTLLSSATGGSAGEGEKLEAGDEGPRPAGWDPVDGLVALARLNRGRRDRLFAELSPAWTGEGEEATERRALAREVGELAGYLAAGFSPPTPEDDEPAPAISP